MLLLRLLIEELEGQRQKRIDFLKKTYGDKWKPIPGAKTLDDLLTKAAAVDPSKNAAYLQWIVKLIVKNPEDNRLEDLSRLGDDLKNFEKFKNKLEIKDINSYKSFQDLYDATAKLAASKSDEDKKREEETLKKLNARADIDDIYEGPEGWIKVPKSKEAAIYLGRQTRWCTAGDSHNMFDHYDKQDRLFVIYERAQKKRYQLHLQSNQFAGEDDRNLGMKSIPAWAKDIILKWYYKQFKQGGSLSSVFRANSKLSTNKTKTAELTDLVKGTDHEEIVDLFARYGVK